MSRRSGPAHTGVSKDAAIKRETVLTNSGKSSTPFGWHDSSLMNASTSCREKLLLNVARNCTARSQSHSVQRLLAHSCARIKQSIYAFHAVCAELAPLAGPQRQPCRRRRLAASSFSSRHEKVACARCMELLRVRALVGSTVENLEDRVQLLELLRVERVHHPARPAWPEPLPETLNKWVATPQPPQKRHDKLAPVPLSVLERSPRPPLDQTSPPSTEHQGLTAPPNCCCSRCV